MKKLALLLAVLLSVTTLLAACSDGDGKKDSETIPPDVTTAPDTTEAPDVHDETAFVEISLFYQDQKGNYLEFPRLDGSILGDAFNINNMLLTLQNDYLEKSENSAEGEKYEIYAYPCTTERYINIILTSTDTISNESLTTFATWCYDKETGKQVSFDEAAAIGNVTKDVFFADISGFYGDNFVDILTTGFRILDDGGIELYCLALIEDNGSYDYPMCKYANGTVTAIAEDGFFIDPAEVDDIVGLRCKN